MYKKLYEFIFFVLLISLMVMSLNMAVADSTGMDIKLVDLAKYTFVIVLVASILVRFPITFLAAAAFLVGGGLYAYLKHIIIPSEVLNYFSTFINWLPQYVVGYQPFDLRFSLVFAILYIVLVTLVITLVVFSKRGYGFLLAAGTGAFAFFWFIYVEKARQYMFYYLFAGLILYSYNIYQRKRKEWISSETNIDKNIEFKWIFNSLIIVFVSIVISQFAVLDLKPVQWPWLSEKAIQVFPFIENWRNDNFDNYSFGFNSKYGIDRVGYKTKRLGGPVKLSEKVMLVAETGSLENLYLRGSVRDVYTGNSWSKTNKNNTQYSTDAVIPESFAGNPTYNIEAKVTYQNLITSSIFAPNALTKVTHKKDKFFIDQDDEAYFGRSIMKKDSYTTVSAVPYINLQKLRQQKAVAVLDTYKQLPDNISPRVRKLAQDLTAPYNNDYDKAKAIEQYLRKNYKYTLAPSEVPEGAEFVDYFLFEGKEGYCTYFATSMAVLLRAADIPCRYVEGFLAKYGNSYIRNVAGTDAHAWVEVNFGSYGWITFEATPAYPLIGFREKGDVPAAPIPTPTPSTPTAPVKPVDTPSRDKNLEQSEEEGAGTDAGQSRQISFIERIILVIIAILLLRILYLVLKKLYIEMKMKKAKGRQFAILYFKNVLKYMAKLNLKLDKDETMRQFWHKVKYTLEEQYDDGDEIIALLEAARYAEEEISEQDRKQLEEYRKKLKEFVTARLGTIKAFIAYYIIGI